MSNAVADYSMQYTTPYMTLQEFKDAPTGISAISLIAGGNQAVNDALLANIILQASAKLDGITHQPLNAHLDVEKKRMNFNLRRDASVYPKYFPVQALVSFSYGVSPNLMTALSDCSVAWLEERRITIPQWNITNYSTIQHTSGMAGMGYVKYSYIHGFVNTTIAAASAGATSVIPVDATAIFAGQQIRIADGALSETVTISSSYVAGTSTVALASPLVNTHIAGVSFSAMPLDIKEACILLARSIIKQGRESAMVAGTSNTPSSASGGNRGVDDDITRATAYLEPYILRT
jgi:hypothetical protein